MLPLPWVGLFGPALGPYVRASGPMMGRARARSGSRGSGLESQHSERSVEMALVSDFQARGGTCRTGGLVESLG
jgi:hypothetical protein